MTATVLGRREVVAALRLHGEDMEAGAALELERLAQETARRMRELAPKGARSQLTNSVKADRVGELAWDVGPHAQHAIYVEEGVKPGGRGLPRFADPEAASIIQWLERTAFAQAPRVRKGSRAAVLRNLELRDRYEGLAWHIRRKGVRAQPFVGPVADELERTLPQRMELMARRVMAQRNAGGAGGGALA